MASCNKPFGEPSCSLHEQELRRSTSIRTARSQPAPGMISKDQADQIHAQAKDECVQVEEECTSPVTECSDYTTNTEGESAMARIERLGRMRPERFKSAYA